MSKAQGSTMVGYQGPQSGFSSSSGTSSSTPVFSAQGQSIIDRLSNYTPEDVNSSAQSAVAAQNAKTQAELGGLLAGAKSLGYGKATNYGQGNMASAAAEALANRDVNNAGIITQAAQQNAQNQMQNNRELISLLSLMRGETNTQESKTKQKTGGSWNFGSSLGVG